MQLSHLSLQSKMALCCNTCLQHKSIIYIYSMRESKCSNATTHIYYLQYKASCTSTSTRESKFSNATTHIYNTKHQVHLQAQQSPHVAMTQCYNTRLMHDTSTSIEIMQNSRNYKLEVTLSQYFAVCCK